MKLIIKNKLILLSLFLFSCLTTSKEIPLSLDKGEEEKEFILSDSDPGFLPGLKDSESFFLSNTFLKEQNEDFRKARESYSKSNIAITNYYLDKIMLNEDRYNKELLSKASLFLAYINFDNHNYELSEHYFSYFLKNYKYSHARLRMAELKYFKKNKDDAISEFKEINKNSIILDYDKGIYNFLSDKLGVSYLNLETLGFLDNSVFDATVIDGNVFVTNILGGLLRYNIKDGTYKIYIKDKKSIFLNGIKGFAKHNGIVYIGGKNVIYYLDDLNSSVKIIQTPKKENFKNIEVLYSTSFGLLVGTLDSGLWLYSNSEEWKKINLGTNKISSIFSSDDDNFILVGSLNKSIYKINKNNFLNVAHIEFFSKNSSERNITFIKKYKENYYVGTYGGGLFELDLNNNSYQKLEYNTDQDVGYFLDMAIKNDKLLFATFNYSLLVYDTIKKQWDYLGPKDGILSLNLLKVLTYENYVILGTLNNGLIFVNEDIKK